ncbi:trypsin-like peptidase domain-containing protein [Variovorax sp. OV700]|uniref:trypsin-like peptidase domain-containing protein n=1 Tax=Variovorax sp. OV700 TaxID=1882826 RepID=UPI00087E69AE|nr:trypsin-like peptidase domain-containing protein [Variovorax sp. OV700]SDI59456.1 Trypsin-like peptidase domain-containing protein [Variovorax sp. OV700]
MRYLDPPSFNALIDAAVQSGLINADLEALVGGIHKGFVGIIPMSNKPLERFEALLLAFNERERLLDGTVPLAIFLQNCVAWLQRRSLPEVELFASHASHWGNLTSGVPPVQVPATTTAAIANEAFTTGRDEMVSFSFLTLGSQAGRSIAQVRVPRFDGGQQRFLASGQPWVMNGTAWVIGNGLAITNHHVVNARNADEAKASVADLTQQTRNAELVFDFDAPDAPTRRFKVRDLVAFHESLDYALLSTDPLPDYPPLKVQPGALTLSAGSWVPLNIVQHPRGEYKRVGLRNNLACDATATEVLYLTDTDHGSSGSPVFDDNWRVVALHRGAKRANDVKYLGRDVAYVNLGSQMSAILEDLKGKNPAAFALLQ